jgi:sugar-phosphatase
MQIMASALLFDSDGVLIDSHRHVVAAWQQLAEEFDLDFDTLIKELVGVPAAETLGRYLPDTAASRAVSRLEDLEVELAESVQPIPGAIRLLEQIPAGRWTIVTSASRRLAEARWQSAGIPIPSHVVTADDVIAGKPDPEPYEAAAAILGAEPKDCVVFEDSSAGGVAAEAAGATVIAVGDQPWKANPAVRIDTLSEVTVEKNGSKLTLLLE